MKIEMDNYGWKLAFLAIVVVLMIAMPFVLTSYELYLVEYGLIMSIFAMGYNICLGYTGLPSLGHAIFYGGGGYTLAILFTHFGISNPLILLIASIAATAVLGFIVGFISTFSAKGVYLLLITFLLMEIVYLVFEIQPFGLTGGSNGLAGIYLPTYTLGGITLDFAGEALWYLVVIIFVASFFVIKRIIDSTYGDILKGVRENEERISSLGYNPRWYKISAFVLSAAFSGLAGGLSASIQGAVGLEWVQIGFSLLVIIIVIVGGTGTYLGPVVGAGVIVFIKQYMSGWQYIGQYWQYIYGAIFIIVAVFFSRGIVNYLKSTGLLDNLRSRLRS